MGKAPFFPYTPTGPLVTEFAGNVLENIAARREPLKQMTLTFPFSFLERFPPKLRGQRLTIKSFLDAIIDELLSSNPSSSHSQFIKAIEVAVRRRLRQSFDESKGKDNFTAGRWKKRLSSSGTYAYPMKIHHGRHKLLSDLANSFQTKVNVLMRVAVDAVLTELGR